MLFQAGHNDYNVDGLKEISYTNCMTRSTQSCTTAVLPFIEYSAVLSLIQGISRHTMDDGMESCGYP